MNIYSATTFNELLNMHCVNYSEETIVQFIQNTISKINTNVINPETEFHREYAVIKMFCTVIKTEKNNRKLNDVLFNDTKLVDKLILMLKWFITEFGPAEKYWNNLVDEMTKIKINRKRSTNKQSISVNKR